MTDLMKDLRLKYLSTIKEIEVESLPSVLPSPSYSNFFPLMKGIISELKNEIIEWSETLKFFHDPIEIAECELEIQQAQAKLRVCEEAYRQNYTIEETPPTTEESQTAQYNLVFGINPAGNISFKNDLERNIDTHYFEQIIALLESLEYGTSLNNVEKRKRLGSSDEKLRGLLEVKGFQLRIIYRELPNNILYIEMIRVKKDDWSGKDRSEVVKRDSLLSKDFERIKMRVKNKDNLEQLIIDNQQILAQIKEYIDQNTIGRNKKNG